MHLNLNGKKFKTESNTNNGEVSGETTFHYHQDKEVIWAEYAGGAILKGHLIGKIINQQLDFTYHHINLSMEIMTGKCKSKPELLPNGKLKLKEQWQWTCGDRSTGTSTLLEV